MREINTVGIIGRGIIGESWAIVYARAGLKVRIWCRREEQLHETRESLRVALAGLRGTGLEGDEETLDRMSVHTSLADTLDGVDYVQESVSESIELKQEVLAQIEAHAPRHAIIGSSTSGIMPSRMSVGMQHPERLLVVHPLTPPHLLPVTELCASRSTDASIFEAVRLFMLRVGQQPVVLHSEISGFALNRILGAMMNECFALVRDGVLHPEDVDPLLTEGFGLRWGLTGPLDAMDMNAPGGIGEYLRRYGSIYETVARDRGAEPVLNDEVIGNLATALHERFEGVDLAGRLSRRDRGIAELRAARDSIRARQSGISEG